MRLFDYKTKFFGLVAENLRRLAEFLSREELLRQQPEAEEENSAAPPIDTTLSPREDWLEKTRAVASENWFDFSAAGGELETATRESEFAPEIQATEATFVDKTGAGEKDFVLEKPEKQTPVKTFFENRRKAAETPEIPDRFKASNKAGEAFGETEISLAKSAAKTETAVPEKTEKSKSGSRFLSFGFSGKKKKEEIPEPQREKKKKEVSEPPQPSPLKSLSEISLQSPPPSAKDEKPTAAAAKRNFRLSPVRFAAKSEPEAFAPDAADSGENQPPKFETQTFGRKKSAAIKINRIAPAKPENAAEENPESIVGKPSERRRTATDRRQILNTFALSGSRKTDDESGDAGVNFQFPKRKTGSASVFSPKAEPTPPETPSFSSPQLQRQQQQQRRKNQIVAREYFNPERDKKTDNQPGNTEKFAAAATTIAESPWIDLPDETAFAEAAADDFQTSLFQRERQLFLEGEQAGKT